METLNTPLEALAFEFGVFAVVNNLWTWIAVVTAAVSFWRIRGVTTIGDGGCVLLEELTGSNEPESITGPVKKTVAPVKATAVPVKETVKKAETVTDVWEPSMCNDGVTKGKKLTTMYYEVEHGDNGELTDVNYGHGGGLSDCGEWWVQWEKVVKTRNGDDSWYRYVDLKVFNGNVVRLWDDNGICNGAR